MSGHTSVEFANGTGSGMVSKLQAFKGVLRESIQGGGGMVIVAVSGALQLLYYLSIIYYILYLESWGALKAD